MTSSVARTERVEVRGLKFDVRQGTSDLKAVNEVVGRRGYGRYGFVPAVGERWIDLGANIGAFSVWAASMHDSIEVIAYEADEDMCDMIEHNLKLNGLLSQVTIYCSAVVADNRHTAELHKNVARGNVWRNSIERHWRGEENDTVPASHIKDALVAAGNGCYVKMDIEGTEMPILEWLTKTSQGKKHLKMVQGIVFEWSFDVDPSIARFQTVVENLRSHFSVIKNEKIKDENVTDWPAEWFPPCRLIWAWNE